MLAQEKAQKYLKVRIYIFLLTLILFFSYKSFSKELAEEAYIWLKDFISINTVNPPGNEINAVNFYKDIVITKNR